MRFRTDRNLFPQTDPHKTFAPFDRSLIPGQVGRMVLRILFVLASGWLVTSCRPSSSPPPPPATPRPFDAAFVCLSPLEVATLPLAARFDPPLGGENGALTYDAQPFLTTRHLGDDLNGIGGWN
jgi:hypothetical protein